MRRGSDAGGSELHLGRIFLGVGDELTERDGREILAHNQYKKRLGDDADRRKVGSRVIERFLVERLIVGVGAGGTEHELIAVGLSLGHAIGTGHAARADDILDHHGLAQEVAQRWRHDPRNDVQWSAGGKRHDHGDRPARPVVGRNVARERQHGCERCDSR